MAHALAEECAPWQETPEGSGDGTKGPKRAVPEGCVGAVEEHMLGEGAFVSKGPACAEASRRRLPEIRTGCQREGGRYL